MENEEKKYNLETDLDFTPKKIAKLEKETGRAFLDLLSQFSLENINRLVMVGLDVDEDTAYEVIGEYLKSKDVTELFILILEELQKKGFLPRSLKLGELQGNIQKEVEKVM